MKNDMSIKSVPTRSPDKLFEISYSGTPNEIKSALYVTKLKSSTIPRLSSDLERFSPKFKAEVNRRFADMTPKQIYDALVN